jgi:putative transposase
MDDYKRLSHCLWECNYHIVLIPKYRRKALYEGLRRELGKVFRTLARQKEVVCVKFCKKNEAPSSSSLRGLWEGAKQLSTTPQTASRRLVELPQCLLFVFLEQVHVDVTGRLDPVFVHFDR